MDRLRTVKVSGICAPIGTPITFEGSEVGHIVSSDLGSSECAISSDIINQLIRGDKVSFSLEVIRK